MKGTFQLGAAFDFCTPEEVKNIVNGIVSANRSADVRRVTMLPRSQSVIISGSGSASDVVFNFGAPPPEKIWYVVSTAIVVVADGELSTPLYVMPSLDNSVLPCMLATVGPLPQTGFYAGRNVNYSDVVDTYEFVGTLGDDGTGSVDTVGSPLWTGRRYGSLPGLPVMGGATFGITMPIGNYNAGSPINIILNSQIMEVDESSLVRGGTP